LRVAKLTRRGLLAGTSAAILASAMPAAARPLFLRAGHPRGGGAPAGQVTTFQIAETAGAASSGFKRVGLVFKDGDVPAGSRIKIQRGGADVPAQFDNRSSWQWTGNSLRFCTACIRDTDFAANESRTYAVIVETGAFDNTSAATLSDVTAATDFQVAFTSMSDYDGTTTTPLADHAASFNTHATVPTRVTKYESGPICDSWMIWGMAANGGVDHAHLKVNWYVTRWKDAGGALVAHEVCAVMAQDWWAVAGKKKLNYVTALKNGATTIETYTGAFNSDGVTRFGTVQHPYGSQWATVRLQDDLQHATRHWVGASRPTLLHKPDRAYWISSSMVPPLDLTKSYTMPAGYNGASSNFGSGQNIYKPGLYQPCAPQSHRPAIDGPGPYAGRGIMPNMDCVAFLTQTAADVRTMRVNAFAGLHVPMHMRSEKTRTRPGDAGPDTANTLHPLILRDERGTSTPSSYYDFTADGLPVPANAYMQNTTDGYVNPTGGYRVGSLDWTPSGDASHAVAYSYFAYLLEGERYFLEEVINTGHRVIQRYNGSDYGAMGTITWYNVGTIGVVYPGTPDTRWAGIGLRYSNNVRGIGFAAIMIANMAVVPDADVHANYIYTMIGLNANFMGQHPQYMPASASGSWSPYGTLGNAAESQWMDAFIAIGLYTALAMTGDTRWSGMADYAVKIICWYGNNDIAGHANSYSYDALKDANSIWNATTNDWFPGGLIFERTLGNAVTIDATTDQITGCNPRTDMQLTADDRVIFSKKASASNGFGNAPVPSEVSLGTIYYVANPVGKASQPFQISTTPGGLNIVDFTSNYTGVILAFICQKANDPASYFGTYYDSDEYLDMCYAALIMARRAGNADATQIAIDRYNVFRSIYSQSEAKGIPGWDLAV